MNTANRKIFFGNGLPYADVSDLTGKLIVIEGTDGVGRSTQIAELRKWLEIKGYGVTTTGLGRSPLMSDAIDNAKAGHKLNVYTFSLLYLADFADRIEHEIIPALKAGFIVLADRYIYTAFARAVVRGADRDWIRAAYGFALEPDAVIYMRIGIRDLIPRVINSDDLGEGYWRTASDGVIDYWESGMDMRLGDDFYDSFVRYQRRITAEFDAMAQEFGFTVVDASKKFETVHRQMKDTILGILEPPAPAAPAA
jgi:dTMP kinase